MKVLVAIDGSEFSEAAVQHCFDSSWTEGTEFELITVLDFFEPLVAVSQEESRERERLSKMLTDMRQRFENAFPSCTVTSKVLEGYTKTVIVKHAEESGADLIVLGPRGRSGVKRILLGSVSQSVLNNAPCSVRIVRNSNGKGENCGVVVAQDDSACSRAALEKLLQYPWVSKRKFTLVCAVPEFADRSDERRAEALAGAKRVLEEAAARLSEIVSAEEITQQIAEGDARDEIVSVAEEENAELIVLGSHSRDAIDRMMLGSVSEGVAIHAPCSVEVVRHSD